MKRARTASLADALPSIVPSYAESLLYRTHVAPTDLVASASLGVLGDTCGASGLFVPGFTLPHGYASSVVSSAVLSAGTGDCVFQLKFTVASVRVIARLVRLQSK